jgi:hypothetical protein
MKPEKIIVRVNEDDPKANWPIRLDINEARSMLAKVYKKPERSIKSIMNGNVVKTKYGKYMHIKIFEKSYKTET